MSYRCDKCSNSVESDNIRFIDLFSRNCICKPCALNHEAWVSNYVRTFSLVRMCDMSPEYKRYCDTIKRAVLDYSQVEYRNGGLVYSNVVGDEVVMGEEPKKCTCCD